MQRVKRVLRRRYVLKSLLDKLYHSLQEEPDNGIAARVLPEVEKEYLSVCDRIRIYADSIPDNTIAYGIRFHYVNGLPWGQISLLLGEPRIRKKCHDFIIKEGRDNVL